jgi:Na+-transporting methylmalonyl-CoA/oxaloacetate decarboxylase gamma subunit
VKAASLMTLHTTTISRVYLVLALLVVAVYFLVGLYPYRFAPPAPAKIENGAAFTPAGALRFASPGVAVTAAAPAWLRRAVALSALELALEVRAATSAQYGPARIFTLSATPLLRNITVAQQGSSLILRLRTPQTTLNGTPEYSIKRVFEQPGWRRIDILIHGASLEISVDGDLRISDQLPARPLQVWDGGYRLAFGNEVSGNRPWLGEIRAAKVRLGDRAYDCLAEDALQIPPEVSITSSAAARLARYSASALSSANWRDWLINFLGFVPFGWLLGMVLRPRSAIVAATLIAASISALIESSQLLLLPSRFPSVVDFLLNTLGATLGGWIARDYELSIRRRRVDGE